MSDRALGSSPAEVHLTPEALLPSHRYVTLPPFGRRQLLVSAPTRVERWRLARSSVSWGCSLHGARRAIRRALAALTAAWCLLAPGRKPCGHVAWHHPGLDRLLREYCDEAGSMVVIPRGDGTHRVCGLAAGPFGNAFLKVAEGENDAGKLAAEARMLREVGPTCAPELLCEHIEADAGFVVVEAVRIDCRPPSLVPDARAIELLESLPRYGDDDANNHPWIVSLLESGCPPDVERWCGVLRSRRWPLVVFHGDFMPYHLATRRGGDPVLVDWEYSSLSGFPGVDAAVWTVNVGARHLRASADVIASVFTSWACGRELGGVRVTQAEARAILALGAFFTYRALAGSDPEHAQQVRASLWAYDVED